MTDEATVLMLARIVHYLGRSGAVLGRVERGIPPTEIAFVLGLDFEECLKLFDAYGDRQDSPRSLGIGLFSDMGECNFVLTAAAEDLFRSVQSKCFNFGFREHIPVVFQDFFERRGSR